MRNGLIPVGSSRTLSWLPPQLPIRYLSASRDDPQLIVCRAARRLNKSSTRPQTTRSHSEYFAWSFCKGGKEHRVKVNGQLLFLMLSYARAAVLSGFKLAYPPAAQVKSDLDIGALVEVLAN